MSGEPITVLRVAWRFHAQQPRAKRILAPIVFGFVVRVESGFFSWKSLTHVPADDELACADEGVSWIRGWHDENSKAVKALMATAALA